MSPCHGGREATADSADAGEFARIDDRFQGLEYEWTFFAAIDMSKKYDREGSRGRPFPGFNCVGRMNNKTGKVDYYWPGPCASVGEPSFIRESIAFGACAPH